MKETKTKVKRQHKDVLFRMIFEDKKELLSLYNALAGTDHTDPEQIQVVTLENAIYITVKNDLAFIIDSQLHMYEHQSSMNPNMPLRYLFYAAKELENLVSNEDLHIGKRCIIPTPRFVVFYNGPARKEDIWTEKLSDSFEMPTDNPELELTVTFLNVNYGYNQELMEKCKTLSGYSILIKRVREYSTIMSLEEAVERAVRECIEENILVEFLDKYRREAGEVILYEFDEEKYRTALYNHGREVGEADGKAEGIAEGMAKGKAEGIAEGMLKGKAEGIAEGIAKAVQNLMTSMNWTLDQAMDALGIPASERKLYVD